MSQYKLAELFAGTGAFSRAFERCTNVKTVFANDSCKNSKQIYDANFTTKLTLADLHDLETENIPHMDILTAGFPCQPFSIAGRQAGFEDYRANVFWKIIEIIEYHEPSIVIFENVKNLVSHDNGNTFTTITTWISNLGYYYKYTILNTCIHSKIPQNRERIYIVCFKYQEHYNLFNFPNANTLPKYKMCDLIQENVLTKYYYTQQSAIWAKLEPEITEHINDDIMYQYRRYYVRQNKNNLCPTLTANMGTGGHNVPIIKDDNGIRKLTPRECFNFQGFPQSYILPKISDAGLYKLAGNAVSYPVIKQIARTIIDILNG